jgi:hypothetical protein
MIEQLQKAVDRKNTFYLARCEADNIDFTTFVVDSIGGIHPDAAELITGNSGRGVVIAQLLYIAINATSIFPRQKITGSTRILKPQF